MTTIKASCVGCGPIDLIAPHIRLVACSVPDWSYYSFTCPTCRTANRRPAPEAIINLLKMGGVIAEEWKVPAEALEEPTGPPIDYDDVLDFALWLESCHQLAAAAATDYHRS